MGSEQVVLAYGAESDKSLGIPGEVSMLYANSVVGLVNGSQLSSHNSDCSIKNQQNWREVFIVLSVEFDWDILS